jgi:hypothetical protein
MAQVSVWLGRGRVLTQVAAYELIYVFIYLTSEMWVKMGLAQTCGAVSDWNLRQQSCAEHAWRGCARGLGVCFGPDVAAGVDGFDRREFVQRTSVCREIISSKCINL